MNDLKKFYCEGNVRENFVLGWGKNHKLQLGIYIFLMSCISCATILLTQFFYTQCTFDYIRNYYCFIFDEPIDVSICQDMIKEVLHNKIDLLEGKVAIYDKYIDTYDTYTYSAFLLYDENLQNDRNLSYNYGKFTNEKSYCMSANYVDIVKLNGIELKVTAKGADSVGSYGVDNLISTEDYLDNIGETDVIEFTTNENYEEEIVKIVDTYGLNYEIDSTEGINESGYDSIRGTVKVSIVLLIFAMYSVLAFFEIFMNNQRKDITIMFRCGAKKRELIAMYIGQAVSYGLISYFLGIFLAIGLLLFFFPNKIIIAPQVVVSTFGVFMALYIVECAAYVMITLNTIMSIHDDAE